MSTFLAACTMPAPVTPTAVSVPSSTVPPTMTQAATEPAPPPATNTALPPSATPTPSSSPTALPPTETATPAAPATPDPNEGVGDIIYQDKLDGTGGWFWGFSDDIATIGVDAGQVKGVMVKANSGWRFTAGPPTVKVGNQQARLNTHTVACGDNDEYGLLFRLTETEGESPYDGYLFKLRCSGAARLDLVRGTTSTALVDWTPSTAIKAGAGADNALMVWAAGSNFRFYVNDEYVFSASDSTLVEGTYGLFLYDRTAGGLTVTYDDLVVRSVTAP